MFRQAAAGPFDDVVAKATDENLTAEDWGAIMEVCDRVASDANGSKEAVQSMIKRLAHRNANVQLYTLELANALSQNCDKSMHRELSSRAFTDALLRLANDRTSHSQVKSKVLERMKEWSDMFKTDADLGIMYDAYVRLKQANPALQPPSAPQKDSLTDVDRQKEEDELQMALKLSLQEEERKRIAVAAPADKGKGVTGVSGDGTAPMGTNQQGSAQTSAPVSVPAGTTAATVSRVRALYDFQPAEPAELEFKKGDVIAVLESVYKDWWRGSLKGKTGIFPLNYVEKLSDPTPEELQREAQMEAEVFAEIKNVEKLLTLLSAGGPGGTAGTREEDNEEIGKLYHQTLAIRPKLIKLIEKYSQKKDDFTQLNEKFIKARRDFESLLETSMSHPPQPLYNQYGARTGGPGLGGNAPTLSGPGHGTQHNYSGSQSTYPPLPQEPQRFYTPAPPQEQSQYPQSTPSPNFHHRPAQSTPAPFYIAGTEVPSHGGAPTLGYPPRDTGARVQSVTKQPAPINTSPPAGQSNTPFNGGYSQPPSHQQSQAQSGQPGQSGGPRPQSTYGAQELATSAYDSPVAQQQGQHPNGGSSSNPQSAVTYSSSVYSQDDYNASPIIGTSTVNRSHQAPYAPPPSGVYGQLDGSIPSVLTPPPLQPSGAAYDGRRAQPNQQQFKPYVPPSGSSEPPHPPSGPDSYYRQSGVF